MCEEGDGGGEAVRNVEEVDGAAECTSPAASAFGSIRYGLTSSREPAVESLALAPSLVDRGREADMARRCARSTASIRHFCAVLSRVSKYQSRPVCSCPTLLDAVSAISRSISTTLSCIGWIRSGANGRDVTRDNSFFSPFFFERNYGHIDEARLLNAIS